MTRLTSLSPVDGAAIRFYTHNHDRLRKSKSTIGVWRVWVYTLAIGPLFLAATGPVMAQVRWRSDYEAAARAAKDDSDAPRAAVEPSEVITLRAKVEKGEYAAWRAQKPAQAARARAQLVEALASFDEMPRRQAVDLLGRLGDDGIDALIGGLGHPLLAVRVAAYDRLTRLLESQYQLPIAAQPRYDAWASRPERARLAKVWAKWWAQRRRNASTKAL